MKPKDKPVDDDADEETVDGTLEDRTKDYSELKYIQKQLSKIYTAVEKGFDDKNDQNLLIDECWDVYNCKLNDNQGYVGTSRVYVPIVRDAMNARETRFINMMFPQNGRYADVVGSEGQVPFEVIALLDYYVKTTSLRTNIVPGLIRAGDVSGQYSLYIEWTTRTRNITSKKKVPELTTELDTPVDGGGEYDDIEHEEIVDEKPSVMILDSRNLLILPATVDDIEDAEVVVVALRYTEDMIRKRIRDGIFEKAPAETLLTNMGTFTRSRQIDTGKKSVNAAGVQLDSAGNKRALIYQVWTKLKVRGERRMMVTHFGGESLILACKRNPYWNDRVPVITQAVEKEGDSAWGKSQVEPVKALQYAANDAVNMGFDSAQYALLPITMTDPEKNPRVGSMVLSMAAIWETNPNDTKFASFPALWKDALTLVTACKDQIMQSLGINPAMMPHGNAGKKPTQAQVAQEQQVALESTNDPVTVLQRGVLDKLLEWFYDLDYQYRDKAITVKKFGQLGLQADMDQVEPFQVRQRYTFSWYGSEGFKAAQQVQQMISWTNILQKTPPQLLNGRKLDIGPVLEYISEITYGPRIAPKVLIDQRHQLTMNVEMENELLRHDFPVQVHPMDDDMAHVQSHMAAFQEELQGGLDVTGYIRGHILEHMKSAKEKAAQAAGLPGQPGTPGGAPGQPKPGGQAQAPTGVQNPPGAIPADQMTDPARMPRRAM